MHATHYPGMISAVIQHLALAVPPGLSPAANTSVSFSPLHKPDGEASMPDTHAGHSSFVLTRAGAGQRSDEDPYVSGLPANNPETFTRQIDASPPSTNVSHFSPVTSLVRSVIV
jgi:hypothetical protein